MQRAKGGKLQNAPKCSSSRTVIKGIDKLSEAQSGKSSKRKDKLSIRARSELMSRIHGRDTGPEIMIARFLRRNRIYLSRYAKDLPGKPDFVFRRCRLAVFVDGEFWHGHDYEKWKGGLSPFWRTKIEKNMDRDRAVDRRLKAMGWVPLHIWGREILRDTEKCGRRILSIRSRRLKLQSVR
jgi:DNA mismatch endonuclease (patch repair protein)